MARGWQWHDGATVRVLIDSSNEQQSARVWDTTEVPSGITVNPESLAGSVVVN